MPLSNNSSRKLNQGILFTEDFLHLSLVSDSEATSKAQILQKNSRLSTELLISLLECIDLTTLQGDDTEKRVEELCQKAKKPLLGSEIQVAAVCVYPAFVPLAKKQLGKTNIKVATVAAGFPHGLSPLRSRIDEVLASAEMNANEIDIVIRRELALSGKWKDLYDEIKTFKDASGNAKLKAILATGELGDAKTIYKASMTAMMAGADFIKTSTGKETVNATLEAGHTMVKAIKDFYRETGVQVGLKPAGGIRISNQAASWWALLEMELGKDWQNSRYFRIGASSLLDDIVQKLI